MECWGYELVDKGLEIIHIRNGYEPRFIKIPYYYMKLSCGEFKYRLEQLGMPFLM